ncbi:5-formyltetrahydrofolate cyclo-ligase [Aurantimonas sp. Leaf443]|uniref:5-formyltetrahydrofolate cyclo-ligase n=1 Tax=Aurantimonas sp. Leaf443 TaxID=1736378 RepID=UPI0006F4F2B7|nr:5-formyltetrahydrofolate cyclo-ligase [Aurantimonas sp. Leaf443]KQT88131.1 5-formyltetrahydrofolate cyclo-ligase [Aurantimonas sp. Leaf443]
MDSIETDARAVQAHLRREALARRDAMDMGRRIEASFELADRVGEALDVAPGTIVSGYLPIRSELDLRPLMMRLADRRARLCVPAIVEGRLVFRELLRGAPLEPQGFGTYAPGEAAAVLEPDLMLVPLAAFDRAGGRIGYGRGYYDGAIAALRERGRDPRLVGAGFSVQEVEAIPLQAHDVRLPEIATETGLRRLGL